MKRQRLLSSVALLLSLAVSASAQIPFSPLKDLGFGGTANDINDGGQIAGGVVVNTSFQLEPAVWASQTSSPELLPTNGLGGFATAISNKGVVAGQTFFPVGAGGTATVWIEGVANRLPDLGEGGVASDVNDRGEVVGSVAIAGGSRPALWINGTLHVLPIPSAFERDGVYAAALGVNSSGDIVGTVRAMGDSVSLVWKSKVFQSAFLPTWLETRGIRISDAGDVLVGGYFDPNGSFSAAVLSGDKGSLLPLPYDHAYVWPTGMNNALNATGYYREQGTFRLLGVAYVDRAIQALDAPAEAMWTLPTSIGNGNIVTGSWSDGNSGVSHPGVWNLPVDSIGAPAIAGEPGTTATLSATVRKGAKMVRGRKVEFQLNRVRVGQATTGADGKASVSYSIPADAKPGDVELMASMGGGRYALTQLSVLPTSTNLSAANLTARPSAAIKFTGRLVRRRDSASISGRTVRFVYSGRTYTSRTDSTGSYSISFTVPNTMRAGQQMTATLEFPSDSSFRGSTAKSVVTIR